MTIFLFSAIILLVKLLSASSLSTTSNTGKSSLWKILHQKNHDGKNDISHHPPQQKAFRTIFGTNGQRGEYMDGYSPQAMVERCLEDYGFDLPLPKIAECRANMMAHLYANPALYDCTSMVTFSEHYVLCDNENDNTKVGLPLQTFLQQQSKQPDTLPIFAGVVWNDWQKNDGSDEKLVQYRQSGMDYVRMHCSLMDVMAVDDEKGMQHTLDSLARACHQCQLQELVPIVLLQVPWRVPNAQQYFDQTICGLTKALKESNVSSRSLILETRPPIGISAQDEESSEISERMQLGFQVGQQMIQSMTKNNGSASSSPFYCLGFCVAGGSTKGAKPTAMQDDTQHAVRQGIRQEARAAWGFDFCYWEMGAKLMLQPQVGQLWWKGQGEDDDDKNYKDAAQRLFCENAKAMAEEIVTEL